MRFPETFNGTFGQVHFGQAPLDPRRTRRLVRLGDQLLAHPEGTLPAKIPDPHQLDAAYRLFKAEEADHPALISTHAALTRRRMAEHRGLVLVAHDDVVLDFSGLDAGLGPVGNGNGQGFVCHNSLAVTFSREVLGLAHQILYCHPPRGTPRQRPGPAGKLWRDAVEAIGAPPPPGGRWVHLADSAADTTELLDYADEHGLQYVIRSQHDRNCLGGQDGQDGQDGQALAKLHAQARRWAAAGASREVRVASQRGRPARTATLRIAWHAVTLAPPANGRGRERGLPLAVQVVRAWEPEPPAGVEAVDWLLLTNVAVGSEAEAWERVEWYACRMTVEEYHKAMKSGACVEELQLTTRGRLEAAIAVLSVVAVVLLAVRDAGRDERTASEPATGLLPPAWVEALSRWRHGEARPGWTLGEFLMALGRLGGHQNRPSDGPPGWITLWRGWARLQERVAGAEMALRRSGGS